MQGRDAKCLDYALPGSSHHLREEVISQPISHDPQKTCIICDNETVIEQGICYLSSIVLGVGGF